MTAAMIARDDLGLLLVFAVRSALDQAAEGPAVLAIDLVRRHACELRPAACADLAALIEGHAGAAAGWRGLASELRGGPEAMVATWLRTSFGDAFLDEARRRSEAAPGMSLRAAAEGIMSEDFGDTNPDG